MKTTMKTAAGLSALLFLLGACETMDGLGKDIENAGDEIEEATDELNDE